MLYRAVSTTAVTTAGPLEPPWQSGAHRPDGAWIGHIVHPYTSPQLRNAIHAFRSLTKAKEAPTERRAHRLGMVCPPRHDTAMYTAFGRIQHATAAEPCCAVSVSLQLIQPDTARCSDTALQQLQDTAGYTLPQSPTTTTHGCGGAALAITRRAGAAPCQSGVLIERWEILAVRF